MSRVSVVVIVYNDAGHVTAAVESALAQGEAVGEVLVVDDCSTDGTLRALSRFHDDPRVRVLARETNSGGCGTPRNDGVCAAAFPYVMFLDSDDLLPPGAVEALLSVAGERDADVVAGQCRRRELPEGRTTVWAPRLFDVSEGATLPGTVMDGIGDHPELLWDTLSVNKLYRRDFLTSRKIRFPDGAFHYEDFVFTAQVYAAAPRLAVIDSPVYIWHVRRRAAQLSISLRRGVLKNWQDRIAAHQRVVEVFDAAGLEDMAAAARAKFLDYDLPMYLRELPPRSPEYRDGWWQATRAYLAGFDEAAYGRARVTSCWVARLILAADAPVRLDRLVELAARPPRLAPPYRESAGGPVLDADGAEVPLTGLGDLPPSELPVAVDGWLRIGTVTKVRLRVHELHGRLGELAPQSIRLVPRDRASGRRGPEQEAPLRAQGDGWTATVRLRTTELADRDRVASWNVQAEVRCAGGTVIPVEVRAGDARAARRRVVPLPRLLLVQAHITPVRSLVIRVADGTHGVRRIARARVRRIIGR